MKEYKQKITSINYFDDIVKISLTRNEWNSVGTWVESMEMKGCSSLSIDWFNDLIGLVMCPISNEINFSNKEYKYDDNITFDIPRKLLRMFVYSIGQVAYDFDVKSLTSIEAQNILEKITNQIKEQLLPDDGWYKYKF